MKDKSIKRRKIIKIVIMAWLVLSIFFVAYVIIINISRNGKTATTIKCAPYTAKAYLDKKNINNNSVEYITDGEHEFTCFLPGFQIYTKTVAINSSNNNILAELLPTTSTGQKIQQELINDYYDLESYAGQVAQPSVAEQHEEINQELRKFLPYNTDNFGLGTQIKDGRTTITISVWKPRYTQMAIDKLIDLAKNANVSLVSYDFKINGFNNQLSSFQDNEAGDLGSYIINGYQSLGLSLEVNSVGEIGGYYWSLISVGQPDGGRVIYRALFKQENGQFVLLSEPFPVLTKTNTPDIGADILDEVNNREMLLLNNT